MKLTLTRSQATKIRTVLLSYNNEHHDPELATLLTQLERLTAPPSERSLLGGYCPMCRTPLPPAPSGELPKYCSDRCRQRAYRHRRIAWNNSQ